MTRHVLIQTETTDPGLMAEYRARVGEAARRHGGRQVMGGAASEVLDAGGLPVPVSVVAAFPDEASARAFYADPDLAAVHDLRRRGSRSLAVLLAEG